MVNHGAEPIPDLYYAPNGNSRSFGALLPLEEDEAKNGIYRSQ